jgi:hypothetical protein
LGILPGCGPAALPPRYVTCSVTLPGDASLTTLPYTGPGVTPTVTKTDAQAFAQKMGVLCNDVFAAD